MCTRDGLSQEALDRLDRMELAISRMRELVTTYHANIDSERKRLSWLKWLCKYGIHQWRVALLGKDFCLLCNKKKG